MSKLPKILSSLYVKSVGPNEFGVFTTSALAKDSIIEYCAWLPVNRKTQIVISNNDQALADKLFVNTDGIEKEKAIVANLAEIDLQNRLDQGLITQDQFKAIVMDVANPTKFLNITSHAILLGFGSIYRRSEVPNISWDYDANSKLYKFYTVHDIAPNQELTYF